MKFLCLKVRAVKDIEGISDVILLSLKIWMNSNNLLFNSPKNWIEIRATFKEFKKSNFYQPNSIIGQKIKSVGLVAGFDDFKSDVCLGEIGFF
mgnify:CR=1 FL=1